MAEPGVVGEVKHPPLADWAALDDGRGGVIAQCEWGINVKAENVAAVYETWDEPLAA